MSCALLLPQNYRSGRNIPPERGNRVPLPALPFPVTTATSAAGASTRRVFRLRGRGRITGLRDRVMSDHQPAAVGAKRWPRLLDPCVEQDGIRVFPQAPVLVPVAELRG